MNTLKIIKHRCNTIQSLKDTPPHFGVEFDIRTYGSELVIHHDPFIKGELFTDWLNFFNHSTMIVNVKEEGLEDAILNLLQKHEIKDFFFLDQSFPFLIRYAKNGEKRCAVRYSEFESLETVLSLSGKVTWVWVDCFNYFHITNDVGVELKKNGFKLCLVSPELQGRLDKNEIIAIKQKMNSNNFILDAVCTKTPQIWETP